MRLGMFLRQYIEERTIQLLFAALKNEFAIENRELEQVLKQKIANTASS